MCTSWTKCGLLICTWWCSVTNFSLNFILSAHLFSSYNFLHHHKTKMIPQDVGPVNTLSASNTPWESPPCSYGPFSPRSFCSFNPRCFCPGGFFWLFKSLSECHLLSKTFPNYWSKKHLPSQVKIMSPYLVLSVLLILKRVYLPHLSVLFITATLVLAEPGNCSKLCVEWMNDG